MLLYIRWWHAGALLAERLSLCGIHQQSLSMEAQNSLKLLVQLACVLQVTQTAPQALLAAWAMLLIRQGKATTLQVSQHYCLVARDLGVRSAGIHHLR